MICLRFSASQLVFKSRQMRPSVTNSSRVIGPLRAPTPINNFVYYFSSIMGRHLGVGDHCPLVWHVFAAVDPTIPWFTVWNPGLHTYVASPPGMKDVTFTLTAFSMGPGSPQPENVISVILSVVLQETLTFFEVILAILINWHEVYFKCTRWLHFRVNPNMLPKEKSSVLLISLIGYCYQWTLTTHTQVSMSIFHYFDMI